MARWLKIVFLVVILVALIVGGRFAFLRFLGGDSDESQVVQETEFVTVSRGTIMTTVNASGNIVYPEQVELAFSVSGDLREMVAAVGDAVEKDATLAYLDDLELRDAVLREESNLRTAEINLEKLLAPPPSEDVRKSELALEAAESQAEASLRSARDALEDAEKTLDALLNPDDTAVKSAKKKVADASDALAQGQESLTALPGGSDAKVLGAKNTWQEATNKLAAEKQRVREDIYKYNNELDDARRRLERAQKNFGEDASADNRHELEEAQRKFKEAKDRVDPELSLRNAELSDNPPPGTIVGELTAKVREAESILASVRVSVDSDLKAAEREVASAMDSLEIAVDELSALQQPTADKVEEAEYKVENARTELESAQQKADNDIERARLDLDIVRAGAASQEVELQQLQVERAQLSLEIAKRNLNQAVLRAPFAGVVAAVEGSVGQKTGTKVVTLVRADRIEMRASVDEADVSSIRVGQPVEVTTYASPDFKISGTVETISPTSVEQQGVVLYPVTIRLEPGDQSLRGGLSANALIEVSSRDGILLLPNRAIRREGDERVVYVRQEGDVLERRVVEIGVRDSEVSEIVSGVSEGEEVAIQSRTGGNIGGGGIDIRTR